MRALGLVWLVGLLGCGGAHGSAGDGEREQHPPREEHHPPREEPHPPREVASALEPELEDPLRVGPRPVFASAQEGWRAGQAAYELGRYDEAIRAFAAAWELMSHPSFLFNIAQAHRMRGDPRRALFFYRRYLGLEPQSPQREAIIRRIQELEDQLERRAVEPPPPVG